MVSHSGTRSCLLLHSNRNGSPVIPAPEGGGITGEPFAILLREPDHPKSHSSHRAGLPAPLGMKMRRAVSLRQPQTAELVQGPTSPTASTSRGVRQTPRIPELVRVFSRQPPRRPAGTPVDENRRARSETGPSGGWLFSKQEPGRPTGTPRDENRRARSETGPSNEWLFSKQTPRRPAGTPRDENRRARSETGPSNEWLFSKQTPRRPAGSPQGDKSGAAVAGRRPPERG